MEGFNSVYMVILGDIWSALFFCSEHTTYAEKKTLRETKQEFEWKPLQQGKETPI